MRKAVTTRPKAGRPLKGDTRMRQIAIRLPDEMLAAIDSLLVERMDRPDRTAVIRELLAEAIAARKRKDKRS
jgi:Arc/MetJ-type ribon-helix-helix transcriptional regulator